MSLKGSSLRTKTHRSFILLKQWRIMHGHPRVMDVDSNVHFDRDLLPGVITFDLDVGFGQDLLSRVITFDSDVGFG